MNIRTNCGCLPGSGRSTASNPNRGMTNSIVEIINNHTLFAGRLILRHYLGSADTKSFISDHYYNEKIIKQND